MKFDYGRSQPGYESITYKINWSMDTLATPTGKVENLNDFKEARQLINKIKFNIKNAN